MIYLTDPLNGTSTKAFGLVTTNNRSVGVSTESGSQQGVLYSYILPPCHCHLASLFCLKRTCFFGCLLTRHDTPSLLMS